MPDPLPTELTPDELELGTVDPANFPYQKQRGTLYWTGSAWAKWGGVSTSYPVAAAWDYVLLTPSSARPTTVVFRSGGSGGTVVATLTITYDGATTDITSVTRA